MYYLDPISWFIIWIDIYDIYDMMIFIYALS